MITNYVDKFFINPAIENGIKSYLLYKEGKGYPAIYTYEMNVIKTLAVIYGEKSILLPYKIDNERAFECNLLMYDLKESDMLNFIKYLNMYYEFMQNYKSEKKATGLTNEIEKILIEMIIKRGKRKVYTKEELAEFDKIFNPIEGNLKKLKSLISTNNGLIARAWETNKYELSNTQLRMIAINPNLLDSQLYNKYGYNIATIASLSEEEIENINHTITIEENREIKVPEKINIFQRGNRIVFSTGNGFVDKLMLLSIIATELMIGMVIMSIMGG